MAKLNHNITKDEPGGKSYVDICKDLAWGLRTLFLHAGDGRVLFEKVDHWREHDSPNE